MKKMMVVAFLVVALLSPLYSAGKKEVVVDTEAPVTIEFWHAMSGDRIDLIQGIVDDFMKENPNITVNVQ